MDEPTNEKPPPSYETKPARYENERERERYSRGSHNPGYYPDEENGPRTRRYSSDDGGTDSRVNTSMHSMGDGDPTMGTAI
nr:hypothetical protein BaRGS_017944 [Batillaria attramentaria]